MSEQRTIEPGWLTLALGLGLLVGQCQGTVAIQRVARAAERASHTQEMLMCVEAAKVGIDPKTMPEPCKGLAKIPVTRVSAAGAP